MAWLAHSSTCGSTDAHYPCLFMLNVAWALESTHMLSVATEFLLRAGCVGEVICISHTAIVYESSSCTLVCTHKEHSYTNFKQAERYFFQE